MPKHTQGPWTVERISEDDFLCDGTIYDGDGKVLTRCIYPEFEADARLIAAAPEMLGLLKGWIKSGGTVTRAKTEALIRRVER
jgi:hypothetical protein